MNRLGRCLLAACMLLSLLAVITACSATPGTATGRAASVGTGFMLIPGKVYYGSNLPRRWPSGSPGTRPDAAVPAAASPPARPGCGTGTCARSCNPAPAHGARAPVLTASQPVALATAQCCQQPAGDCRNGVPPYRRIAVPAAPPPVRRTVR